MSKKDKEKQEQKENDVKQSCGCGDNCNCGNANNAHSDDRQDDNCGCHDNDCHCDDDCDCGQNHEPTAEDYQKVFDQLQNALMEGEKQLKKARDEAIDNARIASSYKKDLERYKERNKQIETDAKNNATEWVATKIIPIIDSFEQALASANNSADTKGYQMIYQGLNKAVAELGVEPIDALGQKFDSNFHNAVSRAEVHDQSKDGIVTAVYQKGYKLKNNDKIIRYAMVEVGEWNK